MFPHKMTSVVSPLDNPNVDLEVKSDLVIENINYKYLPNSKKTL